MYPLQKKTLLFSIFRSKTDRGSQFCPRCERYLKNSAYYRHKSQHYRHGRWATVHDVANEVFAVLQPQQLDPALVNVTTSNAENNSQEDGNMSEIYGRHSLCAK